MTHVQPRKEVKVGIDNSPPLTSQTAPHSPDLTEPNITPNRLPPKNTYLIEMFQ